MDIDRKSFYSATNSFLCAMQENNLAMEGIDFTVTTTVNWDSIDVVPQTFNRISIQNETMGACVRASL